MDRTIDSLRVGTKIILGSYSCLSNGDVSPISWLKLDSNSNEFISEKVLDYTNFDDGEDIYLLGNANYMLSNLHQYLNAYGEDWYTPSHPNDNLGMRNYKRRRAGFLTSFEECEIDVLEGKVMLPTDNLRSAQLFNRKGFRAHPTADLALRRNCSETSYIDFWTQTTRDGYSVYLFDKSGIRCQKRPIYESGVRPVISIKGDTIVEWNDDVNAYTIKASRTCLRTKEELMHLFMS